MTPDKPDELEALLARHAQGSSDLASRRVCAEALRLIRAQAEEIAGLKAKERRIESLFATVSGIAYPKSDRTLGECADDLARIDDLCRSASDEIRKGS